MRKKSGGGDEANHAASSKSTVKVVIRIRPLLPTEVKAIEQAQDYNCIELLNKKKVEEAGKNAHCSSSEVGRGLKTHLYLRARATSVFAESGSLDEGILYKLDKCYGEHTTQRDLFKGEVESSLKKLIKGQNVTVFAYGATGTGKTFTMEGSKRNPGIVSRSIKKVFELGQELTQSFEVHCSFLEIYNNKVLDLLTKNSNQVDLAIRQGSNQEIVVQGLKSREIKSIEEFEKLYEIGCSNRKKGETQMNVASSRSHSILMLRIRSTCKGGVVSMGKLHLIDLAGSEDNRKTGNSGNRLMESGNINMSLFVLGKVINALNDNSAHRIPYRDSKLTRLLQDSLGGSSQAVMICNVAPSGRLYQETFQTLNYAAKARTIVNNVDTNVQMNSRGGETAAATNTTLGKKKQDDTSTMEQRLAQWQGKRPQQSSSLKLVPVARLMTSKDSTKDMKAKPTINVTAVHKSSTKKSTVNPDGTKGGSRRSTMDFSAAKLGSRKVERDKENETCTVNAKAGVEGEDPLVQAKTLIAHAIVLEKEGNNDAALINYRRADSLVPNIPKLGARIHELERRIARHAQMAKEQGMSKRRKSEPKVLNEFTSLNKELRDVLEKELLHVLNTGTKQELVGLHAIGDKRADKILLARQALSAPFRSMDDLKIIGLTEKQIGSLAKSNLCNLINVGQYN